MPIDHAHKLLKTLGNAITHAHRMQIDDLNIKPCNIIVQNHDKSLDDLEYFFNLNSYSEMEFLKDEE